MGIKRIVDTSFWTDGKVDEFSPEDKYFMLYLLTNPFSTQLGIYEISIKQVAFQLGYSPDAVNVLIDRFENKYGIIAYSPDTKEIAIKNFLRHSIIKGGAPVRDCLIKELKRVKDKSLIAQVFAHIKDSEDLNETVRKIIAEYEEKNGALNYSNEKHNDNDNENENENDVSYPVSYHDTYNDTFNDTFTPQKKETTTPQQIADLFNSICSSFPSVRSLSEARKKAIKARLNTYTLEDFRKCFEMAEASSFLKGSNDRNWTATFDWLIKDANMPKVLEGNYDDKAKAAPVMPKYSNYDARAAFEAAVARGWEEKEPAKTAAIDENIRSRAEALQKQFRGG